MSTESKSVDGIEQRAREPVYQIRDDFGLWRDVKAAAWHYWDGKNGGPERRVLYTHPAPLRPVTDAEVLHVANALRVHGWAAGGDDQEFEDDVRDAFRRARELGGDQP